MQIIADLHLHSKYSRATSPQMDVAGIFKWAKIKGLDLVATGDYTHPEYFKELKEKLEYDRESGFYKVKKGPSDQLLMASDFRKPNITKVFFVPTAEISCIYSKTGKCRRLHICLITPTLEEVEEINNRLAKVGNIHSDGRPILGLDAKKLAEIVLNISPKSLIIPAHAWTPWFAVFGSYSGFDSLEECFDDLTPEIHAIETGLSSDPKMNWRLSKLDNLALISNSDAHSPANLGREANVFELEKLTYENLLQAIRREGARTAVNSEKNIPLCQRGGTKGGEVAVKVKNYLAHTIEFFPQEGKYHYDGHRDCKVCLSPEETKKHKGICPICKKPLTLGVDYRVSELADREVNPPKPVGQSDFKNLVPLQEIIAETFGVGKNSKAVRSEYDKMIKQGQNEFNILLDLSPEELRNITTPKIIEAITRVRAGKLIIKPGYDGEYGVVKIFGGEEAAGNKQKPLF